MIVRLPKSQEALGSLVLGEEPPPAKYEIPFSRNASQWPGEGWMVDLGYISLNGIPAPLNISFEGFAAITLAPELAVALPGDVVDLIYDYLGATTTEEEEGGVIDCDVREMLPDLTLLLGNQPITLGWRDYSGVYIYGSTRVCVVEVLRSEGNSGNAVLGLWLLQKFDVSFDMERSRIGCESTDQAL